MYSKLVWETWRPHFWITSKLTFPNLMSSMMPYILFLDSLSWVLSEDLSVIESNTLGKHKGKISPNLYIRSAGGPKIKPRDFYSLILQELSRMQSVSGFYWKISCLWVFHIQILKEKRLMLMLWKWWLTPMVSKHKQRFEWRAVLLRKELCTVRDQVSGSNTGTNKMVNSGQRVWLHWTSESWSVKWEGWHKQCFS